MKNFWTQINKPILALAPMAGITDSPFRQVSREFGADVVYSEMASVSALKFSPAKTLSMLSAKPSERPYVVQLFGAKPAEFAKAASLISDEAKAGSISPGYLKPDGIDINFGCPVPKVVKTGAGVALFQDLKKSRQVIKAVLENTDLPVSIKTRTAAGEVKLIDFLDNISDLPIRALMVHGRSYAQKFSGEPDWAAVKQAFDGFGGTTLANGGINEPKDANKALTATDADGLGLARGVLGRPWLFAEIKGKNINMTADDIFDLIERHSLLVDEYNGNYNEFRKHLCWYVSGLKGAKELRREFIKADNAAKVSAIIEDYKKSPS